MTATGHPHAHAVHQMAEAASNWLASLDAQQKAKATYPFLDGERIFWYFAPLNRHGLPLRDMDMVQRGLAMEIVDAMLDEDAARKVRDIIDLEPILGAIEKGRGVITWERDPDLYFWTIFGEPGREDPWGVRIEGHHACLNFSIWKDEVLSMTPFFFGSNPAEVPDGPKQGQRVLHRREDLGLELVNSLDSGQKSKAIIYDDAPWDLLTYTSPKASLPREEGLPASKLNATQQQVLLALVSDYVKQVRPDVAEKKLESVLDAGIDAIHFAWAGGLERGKAFYYRLHGNDFIAEFDNRQNNANHIHSVWRDFANDFAEDVLRKHHLLFHIL